MICGVMSDRLTGRDRGRDGEEDGGSKSLCACDQRRNSE